MTTKKQLLEDLKQKRDRIRVLENRIWECDKKIKELEPKIKELTQQKDQILREGNSRANFIKHILKIISGEAKPLSKYEVIRDMFLPQLKEKELAENRTNYHPIRSGFLSEEIMENDYRF